MSHDDFRFAAATPSDDLEIRKLVGGLAMPGAVAVRFGREPDYFLGTTIQGDPCDVLIARHAIDGALAAVMVRAARQVFINGQPRRVAYIGQIRVAPRFQGRWLMQRAVLELARLRDPTMPYLGVIAADNPVALGTIAGRRPPGSPRLARVARLRSLAFILHDRWQRPRTRLPVERGKPANQEELADFLHVHGHRRQFFPVVEREQLSDGRTYRGLRLEDLGIVRRDGSIAGVLGSWEQSGYKQETVAGYGPRLQRLRPGYDVLARLLGAPRLPRMGEAIRTAYGCLRCVVDDDPEVLRALLAAAKERARWQRQAFLMLAFDERDPQLRELGRSPHVTYRSDIFLGSFGGEDPAAVLDGRPAYIEIGTL